MSKRLAPNIIKLIFLSTLMMIFNLLTPFANADSGNGRSPFTAGLLKDNKASGILLPGEEEWHQLVPSNSAQGVEHQMNTTLSFSSNRGNQAEYVILEVYSTDQLDLWYRDNTSKPPSINTTTVVTHDSDPATDELLWSGKITPNQTYYIRIANETDFALDYTLSIDLEDLAEASALSERDKETPANVYLTQPIVIALAPRQVAMNEGQLLAGEDRWLSLVLGEVDGDRRQPLDLTLFFTPNDGNNIHKVHMDVFSGASSAHWLTDETTQMQNFGNGRIVSRDDDALTGEILWNGVLNNSDTYYVRLRNDNNAPIDYRLFTGNIINTELGKPTPSPLPTVNVIPGADPNHPMPLVMDLNKGKLKPNEERWYSVALTELDGKTLEPLKLSFYFTPNNGNNLHRVHFDIFAAGNNHIWTRGDTEQMPNLGAGSIVSRDNNPETGELFWDGWLVKGDTYYVRVRNSSNDTIDYWLFTRDVTGAQLGE